MPLQCRAAYQSGGRAVVGGAEGGVLVGAVGAVLDAVAERCGGQADATVAGTLALNGHQEEEEGEGEAEVEENQ